MSELPRSSGEERSCADPELCEGFEISLERAGDGIFLAALDSKAVFSRWKRADFFYKRGVHERRSVDADKSMPVERFCSHGNRPTYQHRTRILYDAQVITISVDSNHVVQVNKEDLPSYFDGHAERLRVRQRTQAKQSFR